MSQPATIRAGDVLPSLAGADTVIVDTETSSLVPWHDGKVLVGLGVKAYGGAAYYLPVRHHTTAPQCPLADVARVVRALRGKRLVFHNAKFDLAVLCQEGWDLSGEDVEDTLVMMRLCSEDRVSYALEACAADYVDPLAREYKKEVTRFFTQLRAAHRKEFGCRAGCEHDATLVNYADFPVDQMTTYNVQDLHYTEELHRYAAPIIEARGLAELFALEKRVTRALFDMERTGFRLDMEYVAGNLEKVRGVVVVLQRQIDLTARRPVNFNSPSDVGKLMGELGVRSTLQTKKGADSWAKEALLDVAASNPVAALIVSARHADKIATSYYQAFVDLADDNDTLHCSIRQAGTRTGRVSCAEPPLQNIPRAEG
jgi:DNA polymerase-1